MSLPIMDMSLDSACGEHSRALTMQRLNTDGRLSGAMIRMVVDFVLVVAKAIMDCMNCIVITVKELLSAERLMRSLNNMVCLLCGHLKTILYNGLPQCGFPKGAYPGSIEGNYLNGKVFPEWFGCNKWEPSIKEAK